MKTPKICCLLTAIALAQSSLFGVSTDPVGFVSVSVPANSDAVLAVPLNRAAEFKGVIQSISGNVITVAGTPAWIANQFVQSLPSQVKTYAVQIAGGAKEGMIGRITANDVDTITVTLDSGDDLTNIGTVTTPLDPDGAGPLTAQADQIDIMPYWTPASLLPSTTPSGTRMLLYSGTVPGVNIAASTTLQYNGTNWVNIQTLATSTHSILKFADAFVLRNNSASPLDFSMVGSVPMTSHRAILKTLTANLAQDNRVGYSSPVPEIIGNTGLGFANGDRLLAYNNAATGQNKAPSTTLQFNGTAWINIQTLQNVTTTFTLQPGFGYVYRRAANATPGATAWSDVQSYLNQ